MNNSTIQSIKIGFMGLGIMNIMFGIAMSSYFELAGKIMFSSGIAFIAIYFLIWIHQQPTTPNKQQNLRGGKQ